MYSRGTCCSLYTPKLHKSEFGLTTLFSNQLPKTKTNQPTSSDANPDSPGKLTSCHKCRDPALTEVSLLPSFMRVNIKLCDLEDAYWSSFCPVRTFSWNPIWQNAWCTWRPLWGSVCVWHKWLFVLVLHHLQTDPGLPSREFGGRSLWPYLSTTHFDFSHRSCRKVL